jgi:3',5'-cyclic AMP phosphodiesterase CpdA
MRRTPPRPRDLPPVAVIADAHVHDPTADFGAPGILAGGRRLHLRTWADTCAGSRAVNESAAAFAAALAAAAARGARDVVLLGDYTDDGQRLTTRRLALRLAAAERRHGLRLHVLPGNHDAFALGGKHTSTRYAAAGGGSTQVTSDPLLAAAEADAVLTAAAFRPGLAEALRAVARFGLAGRRAGERRWEPACPGRTCAAAGSGGRWHLPEASRLIEPVPGLWLLLLDAAGFEARPGIADPFRKRAFADPGGSGWEGALRLKPFLVDWIAGIARRAAAAGAALVALSHYPAVARPEPGGIGRDASRQPGPGVAAALAGAGVTLHLGGHLHACGIRRAGPLTDVAVPSTCAWPPGFVLLHPRREAPPAVEFVSLAALRLPAWLRAAYAEAGGSAPPTLGALTAAQARAGLARRADPALDGTLGEHWRRAGAAGPPPPAAAGIALAELAADAWLLERAGPLAGDAVGGPRRAAVAWLAAAAAPGLRPAGFPPGAP